MDMRNFILSLAMLATSLTLFAQPTSLPTTAPPTWNATKMVSVFCNATGYANISGINFRPDWGQSTAVTQNSPIPGVLAYTNFNYEGTEFPQMSITDLTTMHIDVWSPTVFAPNISLINKLPFTEKPFALQITTANQWQSFEIPLSAFVMPQYAIWQFKIDGGNAANNTLYIANWYLYNSDSTPDTQAPTTPTATAGAVTSITAVLSGLTATDNSGMVKFEITYPGLATPIVVGGQSGVPIDYTVTGLNGGTTYTFTIFALDRAGNRSASSVQVTATTATALAVPTTPAPTPTVPASQVISIYSNAYTQAVPWVFNQWNSPTTWSDFTVGTDVMKKLSGFTYVGMELNGNQPIPDCSGMTNLHIDVWTPNATLFQISPIGGGELLYTCTPLNLETWNSYDIPLTAFTSKVNLASIIQMKLNSAGPATVNTVYVDNIYFYNGTPAGLNSTLANGVKVFAFDGVLYVSGSKDAVVVYNSLGQVVYQSVSAENLSITLTKGLYVVKTGTIIKKVLI